MLVVDPELAEVREDDVPHGHRVGHRTDVHHRLLHRGLILESVREALLLDEHLRATDVRVDESRRHGDLVLEPVVRIADGEDIVKESAPELLALALLVTPAVPFRRKRLRGLLLLSDCHDDATLLRLPNAPRRTVAEPISRAKKKSALSSMHSSEALPQANSEYMKRQCAQRGAPSLTCRSLLGIVVVFLTNGLLALMLNHNAVADGGRRIAASFSVTYSARTRQPNAPSPGREDYIKKRATGHESVRDKRTR